MKQFIILFLSIFIISAAYSQELQSNIKARKPELSGHYFATPTIIRSSFVRTNLNARLGFGLSSTMDMPDIQIGDKVLDGFSGQILFMNLNVSYEQKFTEWLSLYTIISVSGRLGSDISTILADGVNTVSGGAIGWKVRFYQSKRLQISGVAFAKNLNGSFINIKEYINEIIDGDPFPSVTKNIPAMIAGGGVQGAYAINPTFGLQFQADVSYGESFNRAKTTTYLTGGACIDADMNPKLNVPLGLTLGYALSSSPEVVMTSDATAGIFSARLGYTGSSEYELGVMYSAYSVNIKSVDQKPGISRIQLLLKFYF